jgi:hypothetical protein
MRVSQSMKILTIGGSVGNGWTMKTGSLGKFPEEAHYQRLGDSTTCTVLNRSITSTIMWSIPSCLLLLCLGLTPIIEILHSLLLSENTQIKIPSIVNRGPID